MKKLMRPTEGRMFGGVCAAIANYFNIDVTIVRIIWVIVSLPGFVHGILIYVVLWVLIPEEGRVVR